MKHHKLSYVLPALLTLTLVLSGANTAVAQGQKGAAPVVVQNTPLPVSGSVAVTAAAPLPVTGIVTVRDPAQNPYRSYDGVNFQGSIVGQLVSFAEVPSGQRLVIEYVGVTCQAAMDQDFGMLELLIMQGGFNMFAPLGAANKTEWKTSDVAHNIQFVFQGRLYSDAGVPQLWIWRSAITDTASCQATLSGYTIPVS
jgi:hypothetical protein